MNLSKEKDLEVKSLLMAQVEVKWKRCELVEEEEEGEEDDLSLKDLTCNDSLDRLSMQKEEKRWRRREFQLSFG